NGFSKQGSRIPPPALQAQASGRLFAIDDSKSQAPSRVEVTVRSGFNPSAVNGTTYRVSVRFAAIAAPGSAAVGVPSRADAAIGASVMNAANSTSKRCTPLLLSLGPLPMPHILVRYRIEINIAVLPLVRCR